MQATVVNSTPFTRQYEKIFMKKQQKKFARIKENRNFASRLLSKHAKNV